MARVDVKVVKCGAATSSSVISRTCGLAPSQRRTDGDRHDLLARLRGVETALPAATSVVLTRSAVDPAGQYMGSVPSNAADPVAVGTELRAYVLVVMPDARRMPFEAFGSVFPAGPGS